ncbi:MAG: hypothetical protein ACI8QS_003641 [Planctomycetota bacterium]|jgi:hypothetical protein
MSMRQLARFVAEAKALADRLDDIGVRIPEASAAPFLHRQLERALKHLHNSIRSQLPEISGRINVDLEVESVGKGLLGRVRNTFKRRRGADRVDVRKDIDDSFEDGLQGNTWTVPIPDLLGFLATGRKSGVLWVHDAGETYILQLKEGTLVHATSDGNPEGLRLGEVLVKLGKITDEGLREFIEAQGVDAGFLGNELVEQGLIDESDLSDALGYQIQEMFRRLLASDRSLFRFQQDSCLITREDVQLNVQGLLLEVMRQADELSNALSIFDEGSDGDEGGLGFDAEGMDFGSEAEVA